MTWNVEATSVSPQIARLSRKKKKERIAFIREDNTFTARTADDCRDGKRSQARSKIISPPHCLVTAHYIIQWINFQSEYISTHGRRRCMRCQPTNICLFTLRCKWSPSNWRATANYPMARDGDGWPRQALFPLRLFLHMKIPSIFPRNQKFSDWFFFCCHESVLEQIINNQVSGAN